MRPTLDELSVFATEKRRDRISHCSSINKNHKIPDVYLNDFTVTE